MDLDQCSTNILCLFDVTYQHLMCHIWGVINAWILNTDRILYRNSNNATTLSWALLSEFHALNQELCWTIHQYSYELIGKYRGLGCVDGSISCSGSNAPKEYWQVVSNLNVGRSDEQMGPNFTCSSNSGERSRETRVNKFYALISQTLNNIPRSSEIFWTDF